MNWPTMEEMITDRHQVTSEQWEFLSNHSIFLSNAYIGMLRAYYDNRTIWQTCWAAPFVLPKNRHGGVDIYSLDADLTKQLHQWLDRIMKMSQEDLRDYLDHTNLHLFDS